MHLNVKGREMEGIIFKREGKLTYADANDLTYEEKKDVYNKLFSYGFFDKSIDPKLILISLIGSVVLSTRKKNKDVKTLDIVKKLVDFNSTEVNLIEKGFLDTLAIMVDEFLYGVETGNTFGLTTVSEVKAKVKELVDNRYPF